MKQINLKNLIFNHFILIIIFIVGLGIAKDFGISWDEIHHRESGQRIVVYLIKFFGLDNIRPIPPGLHEYDYNQKKYGPIFDTVSVMIEEGFKINDLKSIFIMRHCLNFIFYFLGYLCYFFFIKLLFPKNNYAIILSFFSGIHI